MTSEQVQHVIEVLPAQSVFSRKKGRLPENEIVKLRTATSKTFDMGNGERQIVTGLGQLHYQKKGKWEEIDLRVQRKGKRLVVEHAPYKLTIYPDKCGYELVTREGKFSMFLDDVDQYDLSRVEVVDNTVRWANVTDGVDIVLFAFTSGVKWYKYLAHDKAQRAFQWRIRERKDKFPEFNKKSVGWDANSDKLEIESKVLAKADKGKYTEYVFYEGWSGRVSKLVDKKTRKRAWSDKVQYPVVIDPTVTVDVPTDADDGVYERKVGGFTAWAATGDIPVGEYLYPYGHWYFYGNWRWTGVNIPQGASIADATFKVHIKRGGPIKVRFSMDDVDDAPALSSTSHSKKGWTPTSAKFTWSSSSVPSNAWTSLGVTGLVQEVVNRTGWASGNAMRLGVTACLTTVWSHKTDPQFQVHSKGQGYTTQLIINYSLGTNYTETALDSLSVTEQILAGVQAHITEQLQAAETTKLHTVLKAVLEVIQTVESTAVTRAMDLLDTLHITETTSKVATLIRQAQEVVQVYSTRSIDLVVHPVKDSIQTVEATAKKYITSVAETLHITEALIHSWVAILHVVETLSITETATKVVQFIRTALDSLKATGTTVKGIATHTVEQISITETVKRYLNGLLVMWADVKSSVSDVWTDTKSSISSLWTDRKGTGSSWTDRKED